MINLTDMECFLLDMDGTVHVGGKPVPGAAAAVGRMREKGRVLFLTNNTSLSRAHYADKLSAMGFSVSETDIYTAGNATADYLKQNPSYRRIFLFGTDSLKEEFSGAGLRLTETDPDLVVIGFHTDAVYREVAAVCDFIRRGVPFIATHPDLNCPVQGGFIPDVGSLLALIETSTGKRPRLICGKPFSPIGDGVRRVCGAAPNKTVMIGDRISTDLLFAQNCGFTGALVLTGEATRGDLIKSGVHADRVLRSIAEWDYYPDQT